MKESRRREAQEDFGRPTGSSKSRREERIRRPELSLSAAQKNKINSVRSKSVGGEKDKIHPHFLVNEPLWEQGACRVRQGLIAQPGII